MMARKAFIYVAGTLALIVLLFNIGEKLYWNYYPFQPVVVLGPLKILNQGPIRPGSTLAYAIKFDKKMPVMASVTRQLRNHYIYTMVEELPPMKDLGVQTVWAAIPIPRYAEPGKYRLRWTATYEIGPNKRKISVTADSEPFEITLKKGT